MGYVLHELRTLNVIFSLWMVSSFPFYVSFSLFTLLIQQTRTNQRKPLNLTPQIENVEIRKWFFKPLHKFFHSLSFLLYKWRIINCQKCQNTFLSSPHLMSYNIYKLRKTYQLITLILQRQFNIKSTLKATNHNLKGFFLLVLEI